MKNKYFLLVLIIILLFFGAKKIFSGINNKIAVFPTNTPLPTIILAPSVTPTITPAPTLTLRQITEIRKKQLEEMNNKYGPCRYVPILMYHHVLASDQASAIGAKNLDVTPEIFRSQMDYLLEKGYSIIGLDQMMEGINNGSLPNKPIVLTFDDAYRNFYDNVFPILKEKNIKATVFVISQFVNGERYVTWDQIKEMSNSGLILIGDHTLNHPSVLKLNEAEDRNQIVSAQKIIEENIGKPVKFFAYPYGNSNSLTKSILKEAGFLGAVVTTNNSPQCAKLPYELSRIRIGNASLGNWGL